MRVLYIIDLFNYQAKKLNKLSNTVIRFIFKLRRDTALKPYYKRAGWISLESRRKYFMGVQMYNILATKRPDFLYRLLPQIDRESQRETRNKPIFRIPTATRNAYENSFAIQGMKYWESIPNTIRISKNIEMFKELLFNELLKNENA